MLHGGLGNNKNVGEQLAGICGAPRLEKQDVFVEGCKSDGCRTVVRNSQALVKVAKKWKKREGDGTGNTIGLAPLLWVETKNRGNDCLFTVLRMS